jgi:hypothetical protein
MVFTDHLEKVPPATRSIVRAARRAVKAAAPEAEEIAYQSRPPRSPSAMWKLARYAKGGEPVVAIGTFTKHASIFFFRGSEIDDGSGLLEGRGKALRYITLRAPADVERPEVKRLLKRAFALE